MPKLSRATDIKKMAGRRLMAARLALGITRQDVMAARLGVSSTAYNNYELGTRLPDPYMLVRLLEICGIGPDWVYGGSRAGVPYELGERLLQAAGEVGAAVGGAVPEWPMATESAPLPRPPAAVPKAAKPPGTTIHEPAVTLRSSK